MAEDGSKTEMQSRDIEEGSKTGHDAETERVILVDPLSERITYGVNSYWPDAEVGKWARSLARMLEDLPHYMCSPGHPGRINRLPENLREVNVKAYEPYFISLGPYHNGKPALQRMDKRKQIVLKCFLEQKPELKIIDFLTEIRSIEPVARSFYSEQEMDSQNFVQMLLFDSFYIVTVFYGMARGQERMNPTNTRTLNESDEDGTWDDTENSRIVANVDEPNDETRRGEDNVDEPGWFWPLLAHDLFLLENQLPFFVLEKIFALAYGGSEAQLKGIMRNFVSMMLANYINVNSEQVILPTDNFHHLLHLCHLFFRPTLQLESTNFHHPETNQMFRLGSALQLYESGVWFEARSCSTQYSLVDIVFSSSGKMVMPCLHVDDNTDSLLRNLIALEQMKYPSLGLSITAYVVLLLHLMKTPDDVKLLRQKGIFMHHLASDKEMMYMVNRLSVGLSFDYVQDTYSLKHVFLELRKYSERRVPRWRAWLRRRNFNNPWSEISLLAASLVLLSIIQTYYTVCSYYRP